MRMSGSGPGSNVGGALTCTGQGQPGPTSNSLRLSQRQDGPRDNIVLWAGLCPVLLGWELPLTPLSALSDHKHPSSPRSPLSTCQLTWPHRFPCPERKTRPAQGRVWAEEGALPLGSPLAPQALSLGITDKV